MSRALIAIIIAIAGVVCAVGTSVAAQLVPLATANGAGASPSTIQWMIGIAITLMVALIGVAWRLGSRTGTLLTKFEAVEAVVKIELAATKAEIKAEEAALQAAVQVKMDAITAALKLADERADAWQKQVIDAVRELHDALGEQNVKIASFDNKWLTTHRIVEKVGAMDRRLSGIEAVCHDRIRCEESGRFLLPSQDGVPHGPCGDEESDGRK